MCVQNLSTAHTCLPHIHPVECTHPWSRARVCTHTHTHTAFSQHLIHTHACTSGNSCALSAPGYTCTLASGGVGSPIPRPDCLAPNPRVWGQSGGAGRLQQSACAPGVQVCALAGVHGLLWACAVSAVRVLGVRVFGVGAWLLRDHSACTGVYDAPRVEMLYLLCANRSLWD